MEFINDPAFDPFLASAQIKAKALDLGCHKAGIVRAEALLEERARLQEWLARGFHGTMEWMSSNLERRTDPRALLNSARSVVVLALNYYTPHQHESPQGTGKISRYAWGDDYHDVLGTILKNLLNWIKEQWPHAEGKICVDAQPAMDKAWAVRSGLGWIGKHSNVITEEYGSWVFLGELILNLELAYENELTGDHCGTCTLCIESCPTGAIVEAGVVDATKCISYATIELRSDSIPNEIRENMNDWFYGCDICQDVCPWNRFAQDSSEKSFQPRPAGVDVDLDKIVKLAPEAYAEQFRNSPLKRAKLSGLQRNARALLLDSAPCRKA